MINNSKKDNVLEEKNKKLIEKIFKDNPFGQEKQQTPMALVRLA